MKNSKINNLADIQNYCHKLKNEWENEKQVLLEIVRDEYDLEPPENESGLAFVEEILDDGSLDIDWSYLRDYVYICDKLCCMEELIASLKEGEQGNEKSLHRARKSLERTVRTARQARHQRKEDMVKAQDNCQAFTEIISICKKVQI